MKQGVRAASLTLAAALLIGPALPAAATAVSADLPAAAPDRGGAASIAQPAAAAGGAAQGSGGAPDSAAHSADSASEPARNPAAGGTALPGAGSSAEGDAPDTSLPAAGLSKAEAERTARSLLDIPAEYALQGARHTGGQGGGLPEGERPSWHLDFVRKLEDDRYSTMNVSLDANSGRLLHFSVYDYDPGRKAEYPPKTGLEEAKRIAGQFLERVAASHASMLRYNDSFERNFIPPLTGEVHYEFSYERVQDGIVYGGDSATVVVNGDGQVIRYRFNWNENVKFESASGLISQAEALKRFDGLADVGLTYLIPYYAHDQNTPEIAYTLRQTMIDAKTGEFASPANRYFEQWSEKPLADRPLAAEPGRPLNLSREQAVQAVERLVGLPSGAKLGSVSYYENTDPDSGRIRSGWRLNWTFAGEGGREQYISASVNAATGELDSYYRNFPRPLAGAGETEETASKLNREEAAAKAADFVKKAVPRFAHQLYETVLPESAILSAEEASEHHFSYKRFIDGVAGVYDQVSISIDAASGEIIHFSNSISDIAYPERKPKTISRHAARQRLLEAYDLELRYMPFYVSEDGEWSREKLTVMIAAGDLYLPQGRDVALIAKPMYVLVPKANASALFLDATEGQWKRRDTGEAAQLAKPEANDLDGHWAELALRLMVAYEAIDVTDGQAMPDKVMTRGEMIKMLVIAINGGRGGIYYGKERAASFHDVASGSALFSFVERAVDSNLIDRGDGHFRPDETMSREEMAELITRALGYDKLAAYGGMFNLEALDIADIEQTGHVALVVGLGIMSLDDGLFRPAEPVTRAQAASAFHRFLQKRAELFDQPRF